MHLVYKGKTKDVFKLEDGNYLLKFKDDVTGTDGVFDPGANTVGLSMEGAGRAGLALSTFFFEKINAAGIPTHFISTNMGNESMTVMPAKLFGLGVEAILRYRAVGSFYRRYSAYCVLGMELPAYVEVTIKDDDREDPLINSDALSILGIMTKAEYEVMVDLTRRIGEIVRVEMAKKGLELYDIKFEFGRVGEDGHMALVDEISGGNMRAYKDGEYVLPLELERIMLEE